MERNAFHDEMNVGRKTGTVDQLENFDPPALTSCKPANYSLFEVIAAVTQFRVQEPYLFE
jgi:hypothetical protein